MPDYQGQNYKVNRKVKEAVDKNQINYRESSDTPISIIKRVYIYITDKKGHILPEVTLTIDGVEVKTSYNGLLISNFPNEEKTIIAEKEGYKSATATVILNAEIQTHEFFLALENDDDESEVISTDNTKPSEDFNKCGTLFELSDNNTLVTWSTLTNEIVDGVYTGNGSRLAQGWSNKGLWQIDYDIKYNSSASSYVGYYVGVIIFGSEDINPWPKNGEKYAMSTWEKWAAPDGLGAIKLEGPSNYKYSNANEYHHVTVRKTAKNRIEYYFDDKKWVYSIPKLNEFDKFYFGYRDNPFSRNKGITISTKNLKVIGLCPQGEAITLNDTVELGDHYQFVSYNDAEGNEEWGPGVVEIESIPEDDELYIGVKVIENEANDSFIGQTFYVKKDSQVGNIIYPLYSDELGTETGIYVAIGEKIILNDTVNLGDRYQFISYNDAEGNEEWGPGIVEIESIPENDELYIGVKVIENEANDSFIGQTFYVRKDTQIGNNIYPLYSDELGTKTGIYIVIEEKIEPETPCLILEFNGDSFSASVDNPFVYTGDIVIDWGDETIETYTGGALTHNYSESNNYIIKISGNITELKNGCFSSCTGLTSIDIPSSVTSFGMGCFSGCTGLTSIDIPSNVTNIGYSCFSNCTSLTSINIPSSVTSLEDNCFASCTNLTSINIPSSVTSIGNSCFGGCDSLTSVNIPSSVISIGDGCFGGCDSLTSVNIPSSITSLEENCFGGCTSLTSINIPSSVTSLGTNCFSGCTSLTSINIPSSVTSLGNACFYSCTSLASINIPSSVTSLGGSCFHNCYSLTSINIPSSVTNLGSGCFNECINLTSINLNWTTSATIITYNSSWLGNSNPQFIIPTNTTDLYTDKSYPSNKITTIE